MALPIAPTPTLTGKSAARFDRMMRKVDRTPPKKLEYHYVDWKKIDEILSKRSKAGMGSQNE